MSNPLRPNPAGDPGQHVAADALAQGLKALPSPPLDVGVVRTLVVRLRDGARGKPTALRLSVDQGVPGDAWGRSTRKKPQQQVTAMRHDIGELIANGQDLGLFGDNILLDLDLSDANTPVGARLQIGEATLEVTPKAHRGCLQYRQRFGAAALKFVNDGPNAQLHLRGIHLRVLRGGRVAIGDAVRVLSR